MRCPVVVALFFVALACGAADLRFKTDRFTLVVGEDARAKSLRQFCGLQDVN